MQRDDSRDTTMRRWIKEQLRDNAILGVALAHMLTGALQWMIWKHAQDALKDIVDTPHLVSDAIFYPEAIPFAVLCGAMIGLLGGVSVALHLRLWFPGMSRQIVVEGALIGPLLFCAAGIWACYGIAQFPEEVTFGHHIIPGAVVAIVGLTIWIDFRLWCSYSTRSRISFTRILKALLRYFGAFYGLQCLFWIMLIPIGIVTLGVVALIHSVLRVTSGLSYGYLWDALIGAAMGTVYFVGIQFIFDRLRPASSGD
jgi:hypothetical protein